MRNRWGKLPGNWPFWPIPAAMQGHGEGARTGDLPPDIDENGDYVLYTGTTLGRAANSPHDALMPDDLGRVSVGTTEESVRSDAHRAAASERDVPVVLKLFVSAEFVRDGALAMRDRARRDVWHLTDWRAPLEGLPHSSIIASSIHDIDGIEMSGRLPPPSHDPPFVTVR